MWKKFYSSLPCRRLGDHNPLVDADGDRFSIIEVSIKVVLDYKSTKYKTTPWPHKAPRLYEKNSGAGLVICSKFG